MNFVNNLCWSEVALHKQIGLSSANTNLSSKFSFFFFPHLLQKKGPMRVRMCFSSSNAFEICAIKMCFLFLWWMCTFPALVFIYVYSPSFQCSKMSSVKSETRCETNYQTNQRHLDPSCLWPLSADGLSATHFHGNSFSFQHHLYSVISPAMNAVKNISDEII